MSATENQEKAILSEEERARLAEDALKTKYQESFVVTEVFGQKYGELYYEVQAYSEEYPQLRFSANVNMEGNLVSDAYVEKRVCAQISEKIMDNLDSLPGDYDVYVRGVGPQPLTSKANIGLEAYLSLDTCNRFMIYVFFNPDNAEIEMVYESITHIMDDISLSEAKIRFCVTDEPLLQEIQAYFDVNDDVYFDFQEIEEKLKSIDITFHSGTIDLSKEMLVSELEEVIK